MRRVAVIPFVVVLPVFAQHEPKDEKSKNAFLGDPAAIEAGRKIFGGGCAACHGAEGQGGRGPNLRDRIFWHPIDDEALYKIVQNGVPAAGMPPAGLKDDQTWQVVAFVRSLTAPAIENNIPGDAAAGEVLFWGKAGCGNCHTIRGKGGKLGPDLTNAGSTRSLPQLRQDILDPDAGGTGGYQGVTVVLRTGTKLQGVARNRTNYSLQLQDTQGQLHLLAMADIQEISLAKGSPMPKDYGTRLGKGEIDDIIAYLGRQSARPIEMKKK